MLNIPCFVHNYSTSEYGICSCTCIDNYQIIKQRFSENQQKGKKAITNILTRCSSPPQGNND